MTTQRKEQDRDSIDVQSQAANLPSKLFIIHGVKQDLGYSESPVWSRVDFEA